MTGAAGGPPERRRLVLATRNHGKIDELRRILGSAFDLIGLPDDAPDVAETGTTFQENALLKARSAAQHTGLVAVADDSGLTVDALHGMPGVLSARWSGRHGNDEANLALVLGQLAEVPDERRGAAFVCAAAVVTPAGMERVVMGEIRGSLTRGPRGSNGFGYDPIFVPDGETLTTAEMASQDKDAISHRGQAFRALARLLPGIS